MPGHTRVLLVGSRVLPFRHAGDKNFWLDLIERLPEIGIDVQVLSVTLDEVKESATYPCQYVRPFAVFTPGGRSMFNQQSSWLRGTNNYPSKTVSFPRILSAIRRLDRSFRPDVIHFIDNYGPVMLSLRPMFRLMPLAISAPTYHRRHPLYDMMLLESFRSFDRVVPFTRAYAERLRELGLDGSLVRWIPWGVDTSRFQPPSSEERAAARAQLGLKPDDFVVVWAGFPQQTSMVDLDFASSVARQCIKETPEGLAFEFCFKPEHFDPRFKMLEGPGIRVRGSAEEYSTVRRASDVLLSPFLEKRATVGPALTWLEFMSMGIPVITTEAPGVEDAIAQGESGLVRPSVELTCEAIRNLQSDREGLRRLQEGARRVVSERFTVDRSAMGYSSLWREMAEDRPRRNTLAV